MFQSVYGSVSQHRRTSAYDGEAAEAARLAVTSSFSILKVRTQHLISCNASLVCRELTGALLL